MPLPNLYFIIPVFNEAENIPVLFRNLDSAVQQLEDEFLCQVILIDDGSTDGSASLAGRMGRGLPVTVLSNPRNLGPGACFARAFAHLKGLLGTGDWVVTMEGDNTSSTSTLHHMLTRRKEGYEVILASPYTYNGGFSEVSFFRLLASHMANSLVKICLGVRGLNTFSSFFRLYDEKVIRRLYNHFGPGILECTGFECMVEMINKLILVGATVSEVEMKVDWAKRRGKSKMRFMKTVAGYLGLIFKKRKWAKQGQYRTLSKTINPKRRKRVNQGNEKV